MGAVEMPGYEQIDLPILKMTEAVLPADYPLFDWADWPVSRVALVPGRPTRRFEKACWNAIVGAITDAAWDAGFEKHWLYIGIMPDWKPAWMTAENMNDFIDAFDHFWPFPWFWRSERFGTFEKNVFTGAYGRKWNDKIDILYPEYILGMADRVNLYIQLMRDNYPYTLRSGASHGAMLRIHPGGKLGGQARMDVSRKSRVQIPAAPSQLGLGMDFSMDRPSRTHITEFPAKAYRASFFHRSHNIILQLNVSGRCLLITRHLTGSAKCGLSVRLEDMVLTRGSREGEAKQKSLAFFETRMSGVSGTIGTAEQKSRMHFESNAISRRPLSADTTHKAHAVVQPGINAFRNMLTQVQRTSAITHDLTVIKRTGRMTWAEKRAKTTASPTAIFERSILTELDSVTSQTVMMIADTMLSRGFRETETQCPTFSHPEAEMTGVTGSEIRAAQTSSTVPEGNVHGILSKPSSAEHTSCTKAEPSADFGTPLQIEAGETAKVAHSLTILTPPRFFGWAEEHSGSRAMVTPEGKQGSIVQAPQNSKATAACSLGTAWEPPIWVNGGLWIRQVKTAKLRPDGSLDLSGTGDPVGAAQNSRSKVAVTMGTAWEPPVWIDGGLWIRQAQEVVIQENNELEVR